MIVVDTSALMAIVSDEPAAQKCMDAMEGEPDLLISSVTLAEALIVADARGVGEEMRRLIEGIGMAISNADAGAARRVAEVYRQWSKGLHPAKLNFVDCFAYELAKTKGCPLLFIGNDFCKTDTASALPSP